jgi:hypothetical protein
MTHMMEKLDQFLDLCDNKSFAKDTDWGVDDLWLLRRKPEGD